MSLLDAVKSARGEVSVSEFPVTSLGQAGGGERSLLEKVQVARGEIAPIHPQPAQQQKSLFGQLSDIVADKFSKIATSRVAEGTREYVSMLARHPEEITPFTSQTVVGRTIRQYLGDTAKVAVNSIKGAAKLTPAYMLYRAATSSPMSPKEYGKTLLESGVGVLNLAWRLEPAAPLVGAGFQSWADARRFVQGKINAGELLEAPIKGVNSQPGLGEVFTDNIKIAEAIDLVFLATMFSTPLARKKLNDLNIKAEKLSAVSNTLSVRPNTSMKQVAQAWKSELKKIPDAFTENPSPASVARRAELNNAFTTLKEAGVVDKQYATAYDFLNKRLGIKSLPAKQPKSTLGLPNRGETGGAIERPSPKETKGAETKTEPLYHRGQTIEPSVVQVVDTKTGSVEYKTIPAGKLEEFKTAIDSTDKGIAGKEIGGKIYHLTAKTPEQMDAVGARFGGEAKIEEIPTIPERAKKKTIEAGEKETAVKPHQETELSLGPSRAVKIEDKIIEAEKLGQLVTRPKIGVTELRTLIRNSPELKKNPILTVSEDKYLEFKGEKLRFRIKPEAMQLKVENLVPGQKIKIDKEALIGTAGVSQTRIYKGGEVYASRGVFADLENLTRSLEDKNLKVVEFPEIVRITKELLGKAPDVTDSKRGRYLGYFKPKGARGEMRILLKAQIFKDPSQASKVLAHELGHLNDYLPEETMARGNLVGRIASLRRNLKNLYGDLNNKAIRKELMDLSAKWRPVQDGRGTAEDLVGDKYRSKPSELYADAISVLLNDPVRLKQEAPEFYNGFFDYLDRKPDAKVAFEEVWDLLNQGDEAVFRARDDEMNKSFTRAEEVFAAKELEKAKRQTSLLYQLKLLFDDKNTPLLERINRVRKAGKEIPASLNPDYALKGLNYYEGELKNYINRNFQPIFAKAQEVPDGWNKLGKVVFYERVINERGELANPHGYNSDTAKFQLEQMKKSMTPEEWGEIKEAEMLFRKAVQKSVDLAEKEEFYAPEMLRTMKANPAYATYQVIDHLDTYISSRVYHSVGTLKDIANPATSTVMKLISVHRAIKRNNAKKTNIRFMIDNFSDEIQPAQTRWNGRFMEVKDPSDPRQGLVITIEKGKPQGYYLDKSVSDALNYTSNPTLEAAARVSRALTQSRFYRPLFTSFNLGFQSFNFVRDFNRYWKNVPDRTLGEAITSLPRAIIRYGMAVKPSISRVKNRPNEIVQEMEDLNILGLTHNDVFGFNEVSETTQIERVLQKAGVLERQKKRGILRPFEWVLDKIEATGNFIETLPKVAGYIELKGKMPNEELAQFIRTSVGSPDFRVGGTFTPVSNNIFLFSNALKEGIKTDARIALTKNPSRSGFWWKTLVSNFLPKIIMAGMSAGYFGRKLQQQINKVSEYDKTNYMVLPLGEDEKGQTIYLRIPSDETGRLLGGLLWKVVGKDPNRKLIESVFDVFSFGAGQFPNLSPSFVGAGAVIQYLSGKNPYDEFRGRTVVPDTEFKAGPRYSLPIFIRWLAKNQGLGIFFPTYKPDRPTSLEKVLTAPFVSNILGRWVKSSSFGEKESLQRLGTVVEQERAVRLLMERKIIEAAIEDYQSRPTDSNKRNIEKRLAKEVLRNPAYKGEEKRKQADLVKKFRIGIIRGENDVYINSLIDATTNDEKVKILLELKEKLPAEEFDRIYRLGKREKIFSDNVTKDFTQRSRQSRVKSQGVLEKVTGLFKAKEVYAADEPISFAGTEKEQGYYQKYKSGWQEGEGSYYNPNNPAETRAKTTGVGAYGRRIESGSVAFGNRVFHGALKRGEKIYIKVEGFENIRTPYGNGVFRVDDTMNPRYNKKGKFNIDFNASDLDKTRKNEGRFPLRWMVVEPEREAEPRPKKPPRLYYA